MKGYFSLLFAIIAALSSYSQTTKFFSTEQGLSNSLINQIYQDKKGFIWIATENGLNKFDGTRFVVYKKSSDDDVSLKSNHIKAIFEDSSGNFWVRCSAALMRYDRDLDTFEEFHVVDQKGAAINLSVVSICERSNGDVYFASQYGLFVIEKGDTQCKPAAHINENISNMLLTVVYEDTDSRLWIGTENSGLYVYTFDTSEMLNYSTSSPPERRISCNTISAICEGESGEVFVGTLYGGLVRFESSTMTVSHVSDAAGTPNLPVKSLLFDSSRQLLVGADGFGLKRYDRQTQSLQAYESFSAPFDFSSSKVHNLIQDKEGNTWAGIYQKGLFFIPANLNRFKYYGYKSYRHNNIGSNCVMALYKDKDGIIWVGTDNDGLYALNEITGEVKHYENNASPTAVPGAILCIHDSNDGKLWLGSYLHGMAIFDKRTGKCSYINNQTNSRFVCNKVYCIIGDRQGGLWVSTYGCGLFRYNIAEQSIVEHYEQPDAAAEANSRAGLVNNWINSLIYDDNDQLWMGTMDGISCLDTRSGAFRNFKKENSKLPSNVIFALQDDKQGNIWISTDEGLVRLNKQSGNIDHFTTKDGLASNEVCAIETDNDGNLWLSTLAGISKYSPSDNKFTNFYASDGLQGNEFSYRAYCRSQSGEIFFGGINGLTGFLPSDIHTSQKKLNVYVTHFYLFGKPVHRYQESGGHVIFDTAVLDLQEIRLAAADNVIGFEFSTLEYTNSEEISYQYKLENPDTEWMSTLSGTNRIAYSNLPPGKYKFLYRAVDKENYSDIRSITIIIRHPWYASALAKTIYAIIFISIIYGLYLLFSYRIKERHEMLRLENADRINEAKLQFFTNISHEIRTPMTLIIGPLEQLLTTDSDTRIRNAHLLIYRNAQRILRLINQLMDIRKIDRGQMHIKARETDIVGFIKDVIQAFDYLAHKKNISVQFDACCSELKVWVDLNNFDKVLFNIFSNAFKFTPEQGEINVELRQGTDPIAAGPLKRFFEISIADTGPGIDTEQIELIFERFYQIENEVTHTNYGTGIGLHLARSLVELQQGSIHAENRTDRSGSRFIIRMPMGSAHLEPAEIATLTEDAPMAGFLYSRKDNLLDPEQQSSPEHDIIQAKTKYRILIAEDDVEIRHYVGAELATHYKIAQIGNGRDALEYILKEIPDLVISDIRMPKMDGITLCRKIKANVRTNHIPIILLTAKTSSEDQLEGLDTGADAYLIKPFNPEILRKTVANLLGNRERLKGKSQSQIEGKIEAPQIKSYDEALMERILKAVNNNLSNPHLNGEMLSADIGMSRVHLHRKLKELTNQSARDFIRTIRLKQAGELLASKKLSVSQVYEAVGFSNFSHFSISFREFYGMTPTEYMNRYKS
jgi:ligand-binding sensor domain-containing protein/signal transduction histidine kinase/CheY-like chemotaxis protein/AraC-like DNA-binding protein